MLDCPTYFALYMHGELPVSMLARLTARIDTPVVAGVEHVVMAGPTAGNVTPDRPCYRPTARPSRWRVCS